MPGKHVHFLDVPATPSSTYTSSTLDSSPGPVTPPRLLRSPASTNASLQYSPSHYASGGISLNPVLARQLNPSTPLLWDMSSPAESARPQLPSAPPRLTDALVREPATHPPLPSLAIICDYLPWTIIVVPTPGALWAAPYVTVGDVLHTLFRTLRLSATEHKLGALDFALRDRVQRSYMSRYRRVAAPRDRKMEKAKGVKRVDYLCGHTAFLGLTPVPGGNPAKGLAPGALWALHVGKPRLLAPCSLLSSTPSPSSPSPLCCALSLLSLLSPSHRIPSPDTL